MPTIVATPGASTANSYVTLVEFDAYLSEHLYPGTASTAVQATKEKALIMATRILDASFDWTGVAASSTQALAWPRQGMLSRNGYDIPVTEIPSDLKEATMELARLLIASDLTATNEVQAQGITSIKAGPVELKFRELEASSSSIAIPGPVTALIPYWWYTTVETRTQTEIIFEVI